MNGIKIWRNHITRTNGHIWFDRIESSKSMSYLPADRVMMPRIVPPIHNILLRNLFFSATSAFTRPGISQLAINFKDKTEPTIEPGVLWN